MTTRRQVALLAALCSIEVANAQEVWGPPSVMPSPMASSGRPSLATLGTRLYGAWKGEGSIQGIFWSDFDGKSWSPPRRIPGSAATSTGPSLATFNGRLYGAWKGSGTNQSIFWSSFDGASWSLPERLPGAASAIGPSLVATGNRLYAAWRGANANQSIFWSSSDGTSWSVPQRIPSPAASSVGPALATTAGGAVYAAWRGTGTNEAIYWSIFNGASWSAVQRMPDPASSSAGPSLGVLSGRVYAAWRGPGNDQHLYWSVFDGATWKSLQRAPDPVASSVGPALGTFSGGLYAVWKGPEGDQRLSWSFLGPPSASIKRCVGTPPAELASACCYPIALPPPADDDGDGIPDQCERVIAERFAPIVYHSTDESNYPTNVDWFLPKTSLWFYDDACWPSLRHLLINAPTQPQILTGSVGGTCNDTGGMSSNGTRSDQKQRTFFLADVATQYQSGSQDTRDWTTYVHAYQNDLGGVTVQYWRFYAYNNAANNHGGDWEGIHVILNRELSAVGIGLLGHTSIDQKPWSAFTVEGTHPRVFSEGGGHATHETGDGIHSRGCAVPYPCAIDPSDPATFVRQETWPQGSVSWPGGRTSPAGPLVNLGEKTHPLNGQVFIQYSGIWGSPGATYITSGYWGPVYNETGMGYQGYLTAWCNGMSGFDTTRECHPAAYSR